MKTFPSFFRSSLSFLFVAVCASAANAAGGTAAPPRPKAITITTLVEQTIALNPEIRFYENEIQLAREREAAGGRWSDPELSVEIGRKSNREPGGGGGDGLAWGVTLSQKFDFTGRAALRKSIAQCQTGRAEAGLAQFRRELAARVAEQGHSLLAAQQRLDAAENVAARGRALLDTLVQREQAGVAALLEAQVIEAGILKINRTAAVHRAALLAALAELNLLRGAPPETPLVLTNEVFDFVAAPGTDALVAKAFNDNFVLRQFELDLQEQGIAVDLEQRGAYGDVTIAPYFSEARAGSTERTAGIGVSVPLPLWNVNKEGVAEARSRRGQAKNALLKARRDLHRDVAAAAANYRSNHELLAVAGREKVAQFRQAAELADRHYRLGTVPVSTYLSLQEAYLEVVDNYVTTRVEAVQAAAKLTAFTGLPIETFLAKEKQPATPILVAAKPPNALKISNALEVSKDIKIPNAPVHADHDDHAAHATHAAHAANAAHADHDDHDEHADHDEHESSASATFSKDHGLRLSPELAAALNIRTESATRRVLARRATVVAQVFAAATGERPARAVALVSAAEATGLTPGASAAIQVPAAPGTGTLAVAATLDSVSHATAKASGRVELVFTLPRGLPAETTRVGDSLTLSVALPASAPVLAVPHSALLATAAGTFVYTSGEGAYRRVPVVAVGAARNAAAEYVEVSGEIHEGDAVVTAPVNQLWLAELRLTKGGGHSH
jgi:cobalt-zinc-cadmium efflux system outer membrane protein